MIPQLGPGHPAALAWLWDHWGTTQALRRVAAASDRPPRQTSANGAAMVALTYWSADWTPWWAFMALRERWPGLHFAVTPSYELA